MIGKNFTEDEIFWNFYISFSFKYFDVHNLTAFMNDELVNGSFLLPNPKYQLRFLCWKYIQKTKELVGRKNNIKTECIL